MSLPNVNNLPPSRINPHKFPDGNILVACLRHVVSHSSQRFVYFNKVTVTCKQRSSLESQKIGKTLKNCAANFGGNLAVSRNLKHGRSGQDQHGVDIYGMHKGDTAYFGNTFKWSFHTNELFKQGRLYLTVRSDVQLRIVNEYLNKAELAGEKIGDIEDAFV